MHHPKDFTTSSLIFNSKYMKTEKWKRFKTESGELWEISNTGLRKVKRRNKPLKVKRRKNYQMQQAYSEMIRMDRELSKIIEQNK
jgi:hypothetical protein